MADIQTLRLYTRVARLGSFSAAAREGGLAQSQVSRMIAELEVRLGTRFLSRTTRAVVPTDAGLEYLARIEPVLAALDDADNCVRETGELRVAADRHAIDDGHAGGDAAPAGLHPATHAVTDRVAA